MPKRQVESTMVQGLRSSDPYGRDNRALIRMRVSQSVSQSVSMFVRRMYVSREPSCLDIMTYGSLTGSFVCLWCSRWMYRNALNGERKNIANQFIQPSMLYRNRSVVWIRKREVHLSWFPWSDDDKPPSTSTTDLWTASCNGVNRI